MSAKIRRAIWDLHIDVAILGFFNAISQFRCPDHYW
jgi:hypothetical protein